MMTREQTFGKRGGLAAQLSSGKTALRGSLLQRITRHPSGCAKWGEGHPQWVLTSGYPGGKTRQVSLRPHQVPTVRQGIATYRRCKQSLEVISEVNQFLLPLDREQSREGEKQSGSPRVASNAVSPTEAVEDLWEPWMRHAGKAWKMTPYCR
jgi:hypothetical protein